MKKLFDENKVPVAAMENSYIKSTELNSLFKALSEIGANKKVSELYDADFVVVTTL